MSNPNRMLQKEALLRDHTWGWQGRLGNADKVLEGRTDSPTDEQLCLELMWHCLRTGMKHASEQAAHDHSFFRTLGSTWHRSTSAFHTDLLLTVSLSTFFVQVLYDHMFANHDSRPVEGEGDTSPQSPNISNWETETWDDIVSLETKLKPTVRMGCLKKTWTPQRHIQDLNMNKRCLWLFWSSRL